MIQNNINLRMNSKTKNDIIELFSNKIYQFQTENSRKLFPALTQKWENSLWIGGSGDQAINSVLFGSRNLTIVDINPTALEYIKLKIAAIEALSYQEFFQFFFLKKQTKEELECLLEKMNSYLDEETYKIWHDVFINIPKEIITANLFLEDFTEMEKGYLKEIIQAKNPYLDKKFYTYLKKKLSTLNIKYHHQDILDFDFNQCPPLDKVYLSNIILDVPLTLETYHQFIQEKIVPHLSKNGEIVATYLNFSKYHGASYGDYGTSEEIVRFFKEHGYKEETIFEFRNRLDVNSAFIYQKRR